jgi:hypothetical protein
MFKAPFSFEGRIRRTEAGLSYIIYFASAVGISFAAEVVPDADAFFSTINTCCMVFMGAKCKTMS